MNPDPLHHYAVALLMHRTDERGTGLSMQLNAVYAPNEEEAFATALGMAEQCLLEQGMTGYTPMQQQIIRLYSVTENALAVMAEMGFPAPPIFTPGPKKPRRP